MNTNKNRATTVGVLFILAAVTSIIGLILYESILNDADYIVKVSVSEMQVRWGIFFETVTAFTVIGTSIALFPVLKKYNETMALGTVCFRLLEATMIVIGIICLLTIGTLHHEYSKEINSPGSGYLVIGKMLVAIRNWTFLYGPNVVLGPSTLMTSYLLFKLRLVPRFITALGLVGGPLISTCGVLVMFGVFPQISIWGVLLAIPVFLYEMSLAIWLISKGFNSSVISKSV
jgi:hypothetical protein